MEHRKESKQIFVRLFDLLARALYSSIHLLTYISDADRARKHGLDDVIQADPVGFEHFKLFESLQRMTLLHRLNDSYTCLVSVSLQTLGVPENIIPTKNMEL